MHMLWGGIIMMFADTSRGKPFSKDPAVIQINEKYYMYYSMPPLDAVCDNEGWAIGIAVSDNLEEWRKVGEILPALPCEINGICAPGAIIINDKIHLFYQTYGNGPKDAICHAVSDDGINFLHNKANPIFAPTGDWNNGRAIDADVIEYKGKLLLYFATRDPTGTIQKLGVASAPIDSDLSRDSWTQECDNSILKPELPWEGQCIEAAAVCRRGDKFYMFYGGAYNNCPQQIGCAISLDGIRWKRLFNVPFLPCGKSGEWNSSESGHPYVFTAGEQTYLFFQGNNDCGKTWYISKVALAWKDDVPYVKTH